METLDFRQPNHKKFLIPLHIFLHIPEYLSVFQLDFRLESELIQRQDLPVHPNSHVPVSCV